MTMVEGLLVLQQQQTRLTLDPQRGGVIRELSWHGHDILRPTAPEAGDDPLQTACFPMVPYVNRVAHGRFGFGGHAVQLQRNWSRGSASSARPRLAIRVVVPSPRRQSRRCHHPVRGRRRTSGRGVIAGGAALPTPARSAVAQSSRFRIWGSDADLPAMLGLHPYFP